MFSSSRGSVSIPGIEAVQKVGDIFVLEIRTEADPDARRAGRDSGGADGWGEDAACFEALLSAWACLDMATCDDERRTADECEDVLRERDEACEGVGGG